MTPLTDREYADISAALCPHCQQGNVPRLWQGEWIHDLGSYNAATRTQKVVITLCLGTKARNNNG
jgi:hypothetical protein